MKYVLGVDSGGTKFLVRAVTLTGEDIASFETGPCGHYGQGIDVARQKVDEALTRCLALFGGDRADCAALVSGAAGVDSEEDAVLLNDMYKSLPGFTCPIHVVNDGELAHHLVTGGTGILLIAGTGSICFGKGRTGRMARIGGYIKEIASDEGSGRYIDAWAMHHLSRYLDGVRKPSPFLEDLMESTGVRTQKAIMDLGERMGTPPWYNPRVGAIVNKHALAGDPYAQDILEHAAAWGLDLVKEAVTLLGMEDEDPLRVGIWGSTILKGEYHRKAFARMLSETYPRAVILTATKDAARGAADWALEYAEKE